MSTSSHLPTSLCVRYSFSRAGPDVSMSQFQVNVDNREWQLFVNFSASCKQASTKVYLKTRFLSNCFSCISYGWDWNSPCRTRRTCRWPTNLVVILYYDYALTFGDEYDLYWTSKKGISFASALFYLNRYGIILGHLPTLILGDGSWSHGDRLEVRRNFLVAFSMHPILYWLGASRREIWPSLL